MSASLITWEEVNDLFQQEVVAPKRVANHLNCCPKELSNNSVWACDCPNSAALIGYGACPGSLAIIKECPVRLFLTVSMPKEL